VSEPGRSGHALRCPLTWRNFRHARVGNPDDIHQILGSYIPFPRTRDDGRQPGDPRRSIAERYRDVDDYMRRIAKATDDLIRQRFLLPEDHGSVLARAKAHWMFAVRPR
jgi:Alpha/beta hydrolase domain